MSYALVAIFKGFISSDDHETWHLLLLGIQILNALLLFMILMRVINMVPAVLFSLAFLVHPFSGVLVNDINMIYVLLGICFVLAALLFYVYYLKKTRPFYLLTSILLFALAMFTFKPAVFLPLFIPLFHMLYGGHKKALAIASFYLFLALLILSCFVGSNPYVTFVTLFVLIFVLAYNSQKEKRRLLGPAMDFLCYTAVMILCLVGFANIGIKPIYVYPLEQLNRSGLLLPFETTFIWNNLLAAQKMNLVLLAPFLFFPLCVEGKLRQIIFSVFIVFFIIFSVGLGSAYVNDVAYWKRLDKGCGGKDNAVKLNLAKAYLNSREIKEAKKLLYGLKQAENLDGLVEDTVDVELGRLFHSKGEKKLAAYYLLRRPRKCVSGAGKIAKWRLINIGDFLFDTGFISYAENNFASALVFDRYDISLLNRLGRTLLYKGFFRASARYFGKALEYDKDNKIAIYHSAFIYKMIGDKQMFNLWRSRWQEQQNTRDDIDFQPLFDKYHYDIKKIRQDLSNDPVVLFVTGRTKYDYVYRQQGKLYKFWEAPFETGKYFYGQEEYENAMEYFSYAHELNKDSKEINDWLKKSYIKKLRNVKQKNDNTTF